MPLLLKVSDKNFRDVLRQWRKGIGAQEVQRRPLKGRIPQTMQLGLHNARRRPAGSKPQTVALSVRAATVALNLHLKSAPELAIATQARTQRKSSDTSMFSSCDCSGGSSSNFSSKLCRSACAASEPELIVLRHHWMVSLPRACLSSASFWASSAFPLASSTLAFASCAA